MLDGRYRIDCLLGEGGMGAVYSATDQRLEKPVAVKVMARELTANVEALARFRREALVTSGLGHPHIVQVFDFSATPTGEPFLVMEFLDGEDLDHRLRRAERLAAVDVVRMVKQVASALMATHNKGIVHRDLKPANIYLLEVAGETDFVKVLDFGISKVRSATTKLTQATAVMGTPNYMSPEQALGKVDQIDERTDQWALACIAWECLSGEGPFVGDSVPSILFQVVHEPPPALLPKVAGLHPRVEDVLLRALAKNKNDRFPSVDDFAVAIEAAVAGTASVTSSSVPQTMQLDDSSASIIPPRPTTFTQSAGELDDSLDNLPTRPKWIWAVAAGAAAILILGAFLLFRPGPAPRVVAASPSPATPAPPISAPPIPSQPEPPAPSVAPSPPAPTSIPAANSEALKEPETPVSLKAPPKKQETRRKSGNAIPAAGSLLPPAPEPSEDYFHPRSPRRTDTLDGADRQNKPPEKRSKESEDKWRVD
jgi:serine/threonine-protein kinase